MGEGGYRVKGRTMVNACRYPMDNSIHVDIIWITTELGIYITFMILCFTVS